MVVEVFVQQAKLQSGEVVAELEDVNHGPGRLERVRVRMSVVVADAEALDLRAEGGVRAKCVEESGSGMARVDADRAVQRRGGCRNASRGEAEREDG